MCHLFSLLQCILPSNIPRLLINRVLFFYKNGNFLFLFQTANAVPVTCAGHCLKGVGGGSGSGLSCTGSTHNIKQCILNNFSKKLILSKHQNTLSLKKTAFWSTWYKFILNSRKLTCNKFFFSFQVFKCEEKIFIALQHSFHMLCSTPVYVQYSMYIPDLVGEESGGE